MKQRTVTAIYPGSFDPVTYGHLDIIHRSLEMFETVIPAVLVNSDKDPLFSAEERLKMLKKVTSSLSKRVKPIFFDGLLIEAAREYHATVIIRGIRAVSDYEYELQMALMNRTLAPEIETVFLVPAQKFSFISSRLVKEVFSRGGSLTGLVPDFVCELLIQKYNRGKG